MLKQMLCSTPFMNGEMAAPSTYCDTYIYVTGHTGMLDELVGSHTKVAIYPTYAIHCERL